MWAIGFSAQYLAGEFLDTSKSRTLFLASLIASMAVNALATGLIVFRIYKVFRDVKDITRGRKLHSIIFIIIESGMALFAIQLARLILATMDPTNGNVAAGYGVIVCIHEMINVTILSVIVALCLTDNVDLARV